MLTVSFNHNSDGSVSINSPYANDLLKELVNQGDRCLHYVQCLLTKNMLITEACNSDDIDPNIFEVDALLFSGS
jgi:hypothetical protein